jgi:branched-chain amino acid transport system substrate-binding protein
VKAQLGPLLNGVVNYEYWLPGPKMSFAGVQELMTEYQARAGRAAGVDPLGYYVAPQAYAQMQVIEQAVRETRSTRDAALAEYTRSSVFKTVVGDVRFGQGGGWIEPRVLHAQFQDITSNDVSEFRDMKTEVVLTPEPFASGSIVYPFAKARRRV